MIPLRSSLSAVAEDRLVASAAGVALFEVVFRIVLAVALDPIVAVLWPPFVAVVGLASVVPVVRTATETNRGDRGPVEIVRTGLPSILAVAVGGHALAVGLGVILFLLVDTPIRYGLYWSGRGDLLSPLVVALAPLIGVTIGTLVAWVVPAIAVVRVAEGATGAEGLAEGCAAAVTRPRAVGRLAVCQFALGVAVAAATGLASWIGDGIGSGPRHRLLEHLFLPLALVFEGNAGFPSIALGGLAAVFGAAAWLAIAVVLTVRWDVSPRERSSRRRSTGRNVPMARLAVVVVVLAALVATAGAVRIGEVRPVDTSPEPLPDDPDGLYATAVENTARSSHEYRVYDRTGGPGETNVPVQAFRVDRVDRRVVSVTEGERLTYGSMGTVAPVPARAVAADVTLRRWEIAGDEVSSVGSMPGYPHFATEPYKHGELAPDADGWSIAEERADEVVLELADPDDAFVAVTGRELSDEFDDPRVHESRARVIVDTERNALSRGELRLNVSETDGDGTRRYDVHLTYKYAVDVEVERPAELGPPGPSEWLWKVFAY